VATVVKDVTGDGVPDILVSDSVSNQVRLLPGVGGGFFNDGGATIFAVGTTPGPIFVGNFSGTPGMIDLVTVNAGSNDLSLVRDINRGNTVAQSIPSGGVFPLAAVLGTFGGVVVGGGGGGNDLLVANSVDGHLALFLSGSDGLQLAQTFEEPGLPNPTALAIDEFGAIYADSLGVEHALQVILGLGGKVSGDESGQPVLPRGLGDEQLVVLQPLSPASLALIATLLSVPAGLPAEPEGVALAQGNEAAVASISEPGQSQAGVTEGEAGSVTAALPNQSSINASVGDQYEEGEEVEAVVPAPPAKAQEIPPE
jgi:hypothetical protein